MIRIGLTGWSDHPALTSGNTPATAKLFDYCGHFPIVELDTSFYAIPAPKTVAKWVAETPDNFQFVVKTNQIMTGHQRRDDWYFDSLDDAFDAFIESFTPMLDANKLSAVLMQLPPWYDCTAKNITYLRYARKRLAAFPLAIEFRNQTWFSDKYRAKTLQLLQQEQCIHVICDEPQVGAGSVPFVASATAKKVIFRFHGRNIYGWQNNGQANWRKVRFLYCYSEEELQKLAQEITALHEAGHDIDILFNNNSGHDAAANAKTLQQLLGLSFTGLAPKQLDMFGGEW